MIPFSFQKRQVSIQFPRKIGFHLVSKIDKFPFSFQDRQVSIQFPREIGFHLVSKRDRFPFSLQENCFPFSFQERLVSIQFTREPFPIQILIQFVLFIHVGVSGKIKLNLPGRNHGLPEFSLYIYLYSLARDGVRATSFPCPSHIMHNFSSEPPLKARPSIFLFKMCSNLLF